MCEGTRLYEHTAWKALYCCIAYQSVCNYVYLICTQQWDKTSEEEKVDTFPFSEIYYTIENSLCTDIQLQGQKWILKKQYSIEKRDNKLMRSLPTSIIGKRTLSP